MPRSRILLVRRGGLGDTLLMLPLLRALRRAHPGRELHFAGVREYTDVACAFGACDRALSTESLPRWTAASVRDRLGDYELIVGDDPAVARIVIDPRRVAPAVSFGLQLVRQVGLEPRWPDDSWLQAPRAGRAHGGPLVFAPGSGGRSKCWPRERWLELAAQVTAAELQILVGPTELERDDPRGWRWPRPVTFVVGLTPLELAGRLAAARAYVGNDSGTTHLAACLGVPTVAVFGATDPAIWAPVGPHVRVAGRAGREISAVSAEQVGALLD
ncbi:MAG: glycosyltransferase family 9 protein [Planctomycetes bacterium]|nr:glycosyltransferase family 9 protein [Planctomycetota bacterium]